MNKLKLGKLALLSLMILCLVLAPLANPLAATHNIGLQNPNRGSAEQPYDRHLQETADAGYFVLRSEGTQAACHDALPEEVKLYNQRDPNQELHILKTEEGASIQPQASDGLTLTLRTTAQL